MRKLFFLLVLLAGCESDADKLERLRGDVALAELTIYNLKNEVGAASRNATADSIMDAMLAASESISLLDGQAFLDAYDTYKSNQDQLRDLVDSLRALPPSDSQQATIDSLNNEIHEATIERDLAQRELNRFMSE